MVEAASYADGEVILREYPWDVLDFAIADEWDTSSIRSAIGRIANSLRKRSKERLTRRQSAT